MDGVIEIRIRTLLRVICDLRVPEEGDEGLQVNRPEGLTISELSWLEDLVEAIAREILLTFDLREKTKDDDPEEVEKWKKPVTVGGWVERRKNHRLRIRTEVDDLFEKSFPDSNVSASVRAWKIQIADQCADAILERFHVRPASSGPWAFYRRMMYEIGEKLQQALAYKDLFLMTGRIAEAQTMEATIESAYQAVCELMQDLNEEEPLSG